VTRAYLGLAALDALLLVAGLGVLAALGLVRSRGSALRLAGLAFTVGWAAVGIAAVLLLVVGIPLTPWSVAVVCVALGALGSVRRAPAVPEPARRRSGRLLPLVVLSAAVVVLFVVELGRRAFAAGAAYHQDAWGFWLPKAKLIALTGGLDTGAGGVTSFAHADYPPLVPALDAVAFRFMDGLHASALPVQEWVIATAFLGALAGLLARRVPPWVLWPCLALIALSPAFGRWVGVGLADPQLAYLFALAGVCVALWLLDGPGAWVALAALLLAAAALTKVEGRSLGLVLALVATLACARSLRSRWPGLVALVAAPVLAPLAWRLWLAANDVPLTPDYRLRDALDPTFLADRLDRLGTALADLPGYAAGGDGWLLLLPVALAAAALVARPAPGLALLLGATPLAVLAGLAVVYWVGSLPVEAYIDTSAERAVLSPALFAAALLPLALAVLVEEASD
jgi:hypothetical protein